MKNYLYLFDYITVNHSQVQNIFIRKFQTRDFANINIQITNKRQLFNIENSLINLFPKHS